MRYKRNRQRTKEETINLAHANLPGGLGQQNASGAATVPMIARPRTRSMNHVTHPVNPSTGGEEVKDIVVFNKIDNARTNKKFEKQEAVPRQYLNLHQVSHPNQ